jgi:hypothetical protein
MKLPGVTALFRVDITLYSYIPFLVPEREENIFNLFWLREVEEFHSRRR